MAFPPDGQAKEMSARDWLLKGHTQYFRGRHTRALKSYRRAIKLNPTLLAARLNGSVVLDELSRPGEAARWLRNAADLSKDPAILHALAQAEWNLRRLSAAKKRWGETLRRKKDHGWALVGMARMELRAAHPHQALEHLQKAAEASPLLPLVPYLRGNAYKLLRDRRKARASYREALVADSNLSEARRSLARIGGRAPLIAMKNPAGSSSVESDLGAEGTPLLRVGLGTGAMGHPSPRGQAGFSVNVPFSIVSARSGRRLARGKAGSRWLVKARKRRKKTVLEFYSDGKRRLRSRRPVLVRPDSASRAVFRLEDEPTPKHPARGAKQRGTRASIRGRRVRGELEFALSSGGGLILINRIGLEDYTNGVVSREMPINSPVEALKAQSVMARTHALHLKETSRRHRHDGYDLCDRQHCQVYGGVAAESPRSFAVVRATRGRIVAYKGKVAQVTYSANCGGHTQGAHEVKGWKAHPYLTGAPDRNQPAPAQSPWELRQRLMSLPRAYCQASPHVPPSQYRWARIIPFSRLEKILSKKHRLGSLKGVRPGKRSSSGNVNSLHLMGSRKSVKLETEMGIRGLLGPGTFRSTMFVTTTEYRRVPGRKGKKKRLVPHNLIVYGGGWGHGVGLCQSGAMGRAQAGQDYEEILRHYLKGIELGQLEYSAP